MTPDPAPASERPDWIRGNLGNSPALMWSFTTEGRLTALALARESAEVFAADDAGVMCRLDRQGRIAAITRLHDPLHVLAWSDDGRVGAAVCGESTLHLFDHVLKSQWSVDLPAPPIAVAVSPFGTHIAVSLADATNRIYDAGKKKLATFESMRPLAHLQFISTETGLVAAAEHGLICRLDLGGRLEWGDKLWSNVGQLAISGDAELIYLACNTHGVQVYDGSGGSVGSYVLEGTVNHAAVSFEPQRIIASTVERTLYWLDSDGEVLWRTIMPDDVAALACDPLGEWVICGLRCGRVYRLDWTRKG
ncbi:MAG: WD40 repeat domain-containing protein [Planctomycetaceae bacterium]